MTSDVGVPTGMSAHLPECEPDLQLPDGSFIACICDRLRAAYERGAEEEHQRALVEIKEMRNWYATRAPQRFDYEQGRSDALDAARQAVAALGGEPSVSLDPIDCNYSCDDGECTCSGVRRVRAWSLNPAAALAAIDALKGKP